VDSTNRQGTPVTLDNASAPHASYRLQLCWYDLGSDRHCYDCHDIVPPRSFLINEIEDDGVDHGSSNVRYRYIVEDGTTNTRNRYATVLIVFVSGTSA